jgi:hypothetical protein
MSPAPAHARARSLRYLNSTDRRRHVAARRQPVPEFVEVPFQVPLELRDRLAIDAGGTLVGLDPQVRLPDRSFGNHERLRRTHRLLPADAGWPPNPSGRPVPFAPPALPGLTATTRRSAPVPRIATHPSRCLPLGVLAWRPAAGQHRATGRAAHRDDRFPRSTPEPEPSSRHLHAGHRLASLQAPSRLIPRPLRPSVSMSSKAFRHVISGSLTFAFSAPT